MCDGYWWEAELINREWVKRFTISHSMVHPGYYCRGFWFNSYTGKSFNSYYIQDLTYHWIGSSVPITRKLLSAYLLPKASWITQKPSFITTFINPLNCIKKPYFYRFLLNPSPSPNPIFNLTWKNAGEKGENEVRKVIKRSDCSQGTILAIHWYVRCNPPQVRTVQCTVEHRIDSWSCATLLH